MWSGAAMRGVGATAVAFVLGAVTASCGGGNATVANNSHNNSNNTGRPDAGASTDSMTSTDPLPATPGVVLSGGLAASPGGQGQAGGAAHLASAGPITIGPDVKSPPIPMVGSAPADSRTVSSQGLGTDVAVPGSASVSGTVDSGGSDAVRQIVSGGDIFIGGTLRSATLGAARQGLTLKAPKGTVYVVGAIDASGDAGTGQAGGPLTIIAQRLVVTGKLSTAGGNGASGGAAGAISITTTAGVFLSGELEASGGNAQGSAPATGGQGASVSIQAGDDVVIGGIARVRGGAATGTATASVQGGNAGTITIEGTATVAFTGTLDASGGAASTTGSGAPVGGTAGTLKVGETTRPMAIGLSVPLLAKGGDGQAVGGGGGAVLLEPHGGDLRISGLVDASGGRSAIKPGAGGSIEGHPGPEDANAGLDVGGQVVANGGSTLAGSSGAGALGGTIKLVLLSKTGNTTIEPGAQVQTDGGGSGGTGTAGAAASCTSSPSTGIPPSTDSCSPAAARLPTQAASGEWEDSSTSSLVMDTIG